MMFLSFFLLFFVPFFVYGVECFFFSQMIRGNTNIIRGELIDGFCVNNWLWQSLNIQLTKLYGKFNNTDDIVPKISRYEGNK